MSRARYPTTVRSDESFTLCQERLQNNQRQLVLSRTIPETTWDWVWGIPEGIESNGCYQATTGGECLYDVVPGSDCVRLGLLKIQDWSVDLCRTPLDGHRDPARSSEPRSIRDYRPVARRSVSRSGP